MLLTTWLSLSPLTVVTLVTLVTGGCGDCGDCGDSVDPRVPVVVDAVPETTSAVSADLVEALLLLTGLCLSKPCGLKPRPSSNFLNYNCTTFLLTCGVVHWHRMRRRRLNVTAE